MRWLVLLVILMAPNGFEAQTNMFDTNNPYAFHMFENFQLCSEVFKRETKFLLDLKETRNRLVDKLDSLKAMKTKENIGSNHGAHLSTANQQIEDMSDRFKESTFDFPNAKDAGGAINGMVLLFDTYKYELKDVLNGTLNKINFASGQKVFFPTNEKLTYRDLITFANLAYNKTWYDTAIPLVKTVFEILPLIPKQDRPSKAEYKELVKLRKNLVHLNNQWLLKFKTLADAHFKVLQYVVDDKLNPKKKQPKSIAQGELYFANKQSYQGKEHYFRQVCNGFSHREQFGIVYLHKCKYLHHNNPYLKLGPFKIEQAHHEPYIIIYHDIFTQHEMDHLINTSLPHLSRNRTTFDFSNAGAAHEFKGRHATKRRVIHKTVQHWMDDIIYEEMLDDPLELDTNFDYKVMDPILFKLSKKFEIATKMNVTAKYASTLYQTTNYGLGGLCETHMDPHGYLEGGNMKLPENRKNLQTSGDMKATLMGWIADEPVGGATAFVHPMNEVTVYPTKGSAAFWFTVDKKGHRDRHAFHGGCPVLYGSKWIVNKWLNYYDSVDNFPCSLDPNEKEPGFDGVYE